MRRCLTLRTGAAQHRRKTACISTYRAGDFLLRDVPGVPVLGRAGQTPGPGEFGQPSPYEQDPARTDPSLTHRRAPPLGLLGPLTPVRELGSGETVRSMGTPAAMPDPTSSLAPRW